MRLLLILLAAITAPSPAPIARPAFVPIAAPTLPPDYVAAVNNANTVNLLYSIFAPYCAKDGGISRIALQSPTYPVLIECVRQRLSVGPDLKITRLGP